MENILYNAPIISSGVGFLVWTASKFLRERIVRKTASDVFESGNSINYNDVKLWTKLLNVVAPAFLGIITGIGAIVAELSGHSDLALGLTAFALPHLIEIPFNKKVVSNKNDNSNLSGF